MKNFLIALITFVPAYSCAGISANVTVTTDYIWRGMTQSDGPALQGGFDYSHESGLYAGIWGSNVNFNNGNGQELDYLAGYKFKLGEVNADLGYIKYNYPNSNPNLNFEEIMLGLSLGNFGLSFAAGLNKAPDYIEASYKIGDVSLSLGDYKNNGANAKISYNFKCLSLDCGVTAYNFNNAGSGADKDGVFLSVGKSM
jgi:uncharacterized protein (TIGR02001 family)